MSIDRRKLEALLKWYRQEVGKSLVAALLIKNDGTIFENIIGHSLQVIDDNLIESVKDVIQLILKRITEDFKLSSFGAGTFDTAKYRFIFCKAGPDYVLISILDPLAMVDLVFPYAYIAAEKTARILDGRPVSPVIPTLHAHRKAQDIKRKIDMFQKIKIHSQEYAFKLILAGDGAVGKTSMVHRFVEGEFKSDYKATIGTSIMKKECEFKGLESKVRFVIWDLAGQEQFMRVRQSYLTNSEAGLLVYDVTNRESFRNARKWHEEVKKSASENLFLILVGNKIDLINDRVVSIAEGMELARELELSYLETSAKTGERIIEAFRMLALQLIRGYFETEELGKKEDYHLESEPIKIKIPQNKEEELRDQLTNVEKKRLGFWEGLIEKIKETSLHIPLLKEGLIYTYIISDKWAGIELCFYHEDKLVNKKRFKELESYKYKIQEEFTSLSWQLSEMLEWNYKENRNYQMIMYKFKNLGLNQQYQWYQIQYKIIDGMKCFIKTMQKYTENLE